MDGVGPDYKQSGLLAVFSDSKDSFSSLESAFTILAIIIGGIWAYMLFVRKREKFPRAEIKHRTAFWDISESQRLVRVTLSMENKSDVLLRMFDGFTWLQQMKPWPDELIQGFTEASKTPDKSAPELACSTLNVGW